MTATDPRHAVVRAYFEAMAAGPAGEEDLLALFTDDAVYIEPFSGTARTHAGAAAIRANLQASWDERPPDLTLAVHRIDTEGDDVVARWSCDSPAFPAPVHGTDRYRIADGRITRLETTFAS